MIKSKKIKNLLKIMSGASAISVGVVGGLAASNFTTHVSTHGEASFDNEEAVFADNDAAIIDSIHDTVNELKNYKNGDQVSDSAKNLISAIKDAVISNPPTYDGTPTSQIPENAFQDITINHLSLDSMFNKKELIENSRVNKKFADKNSFPVFVSPSQLTTKTGQNVNFGGVVSFQGITLHKTLFHHGVLNFEKSNFSSLKIEDENYDSVYNAVSVLSHYTKGDSLSPFASQILNGFNKGLAQYGVITSINANQPPLAQFSTQILRNYSQNKYTLDQTYTITTDQNKIIQLGGRGASGRDVSIEITKEGENLIVNGLENLSPETFTVSDSQSSNVDKAVLIDSINQVGNGEESNYGPFSKSFSTNMQTAAYKYLGDLSPVGGGLGGLHFSPISSENITKTSNGYQIKIDNLHIVVPTGYSDGSSLTYDGNGTIDIEGEGSDMYLSSILAAILY